MPKFFNSEARKGLSDYRLHNLKDKLCKEKNSCGLDALMERFDYEFSFFEPLEDDDCKDNIVALLSEVAEALRKAEIVLNPGYGFMADSLIMALAGVTAVKPVAEGIDWTDWAWQLPFSRFEMSFKNGCTLTLETGTGGVEVVRKVLRNRNDVFIIEAEPGIFELSYLVKRSIENLTVKIVEYEPLDRIRPICRKGWRPLDAATLAIFRSGRTENVIGFGPEGMRKWLVEFLPESMGDLCLLNALYYPGRTNKYDEVLRRRQHPETITFPDGRAVWNVLRETYGVLVYQEQAMVLQEAGIEVDIPLKELALKGHTIARTMIAIESARLLE